MIPAPISSRLLAPIAGGLFLAGVWMGWHARGVSERAAESERLKAQMAATASFQRDALQMSTELEFDIAALRESRRAVIIEREKEIAKPAYAACPVPADGLRLLNARVAAPAAR